MSVSLTRRYDQWNDFFSSSSNNLRCKRLSTKRPGLENNTGPVENVKMARDARGWRRIMIMTRMAARVTAPNYQVSWGPRTMVRRIFETGNIIRHSRYVSCQSISWNQKKFMLLKRNVLEISLGDILISWHQKSCSQTIRMTICFRWWKISWWLWLRQTGLTTIYCLLLCLWNMFWMWQAASGRGERGRGPLIYFDCEWNFQFSLRPSGKMEACDSPTGLSVSWVSHRKPFLFVRSGSGRQVLWWLLTGDQRALNCHVVCVGCGVSGDIVMSASLLTPHYRDTLRLSGTQTLRHRRLWVSLNPTLGSNPGCREKVPDRLATIPQNSRCVSCHQLRRSHPFNTRRDSSSASENWINVGVKRGLVLGNRITV